MLFRLSFARDSESVVRQREVVPWNLVLSRVTLFHPFAEFKLKV